LFIVLSIQDFRYFGLATFMAGDSWHSLKFIRADEKNIRIIYMTIFGQFDSGNRVKDPELV
jgi:hypothetical protein